MKDLDSVKIPPGEQTSQDTMQCVKDFFLALNLPLSVPLFMSHKRPHKQMNTEMNLNSISPHFIWMPVRNRSNDYVKAPKPDKLICWRALCSEFHHQPLKFLTHDTRNRGEDVLVSQGVLAFRGLCGPLGSRKGEK